MGKHPKRKYKIVYILGDLESDILNNKFSSGPIEMNCVINNMVFSDMHVAIGYMTCIVHNKTSNPFYLHASKDGRGYLAIGVCDAENTEDDKLVISDILPFTEEIPKTLQNLHAGIKKLEGNDK